MMVAVFAAMSAALVFGWLGRRREATACLVLSLVLATGLFLWEVYSPEYGFRMPWIQVERALDPLPKS
jgi:ABC-type Mn2+/Zn2+ transport system permease subunit